ncbi:toll/interleukin-1 receptor domain-containing protein [Microbacterium sp. RU33B]|uniref:toll/interleukin-1 receptor domain-containing protein n=1 Tax=Microbacterium sp. RU33B TaxID=1907390 RepID=UPI00095EB92D|nr:toll/interleukin-1 receptor domain-containing protein [Microbacterium sp. RU33B]SIT72478.1 TIR domain-containing protein [Microbacterium sp. RU33B]
MPDVPQPKAFISHASEDKDSFVVEFATKLRLAGVDAWVDEWEIRAGDSLVDKVFAHGIEGADVFIVVLSETSAGKPWVREELDAGVVRRINRGTRLIPVLIDDVEVPPALQHLRWVSVSKLGLEGAVQDIVGTLFGSDLAPPLGSPPAYSRRAPKMLPNPVDDAVLNAAADLILERGAGGFGATQLLERLSDLDLSTALVEEAIASLAEQGLVEVSRSFGGSTIMRFRAQTWLALLKARGVDVNALLDQLLALLVNTNQTRGFDEDRETVHALVTVLEYDGLIGRVTWTISGTAHAQATVAGQRRAREL